jgi:anti-anti-sigma regulatory factor
MESVGSPLGRQFDGAPAMLEIAPGWKMEMDRGPNWLFVRLLGKPQADAGDVDLRRRLWDLLQVHFTSRLVLELNEAPALDRKFVDQLVELGQQISERGGQLKLCGVSDENREALHACAADSQLPIYQDREQAVLGFRPPRHPK